MNQNQWSTCGFLVLFVPNPSPPPLSKKDFDASSGTSLEAELQRLCEEEAEAVWGAEGNEKRMKSAGVKWVEVVRLVEVLSGFLRHV